MVVVVGNANILSVLILRPLVVQEPRERLRDRLVSESIVEISCSADAVAAQQLPRRLVDDAEIEEGLVDPVDNPVERDARVQHQIDDVGGSEVLHVLDPDLEQPRLVPDVESVEVPQLVLRFERVHDKTKRLANEELLKHLPAHRREDTDDERERGACRLARRVRQQRVDHPDDQDDDDDSHRRVDVRRRFEIVLEVAANEHLEDVEVGAEECEGERLAWDCGQVGQFESGGSEGAVQQLSG